MAPLAFAVILAIFAPTSVNASVQNDDCTQFSDLTPPTAKDTAGKEINSTRAGQLVIIFSIFSNPCGFDQQVVIITEARSPDNATVFFHSATASASAFNSSEVGVLWYPENGGTYELRSFAISNSTGSRILTDVQTRELSVVDYSQVHDALNGGSIPVALQR